MPGVVAATFFFTILGEKGTSQLPADVFISVVAAVMLWGFMFGTYEFIDGAYLFLRRRPREIILRRLAANLVASFVGLLASALVVPIVSPAAAVVLLALALLSPIVLERSLGLGLVVGVGCSATFAAIGGEQSGLSGYDAAIPLIALLFSMMAQALLYWRRDKSLAACAATLNAERAQVAERERIRRDAHDRIWNALAAHAKRLELLGRSLSGESAELAISISADIRGIVSELQEILSDHYAPPDVAARASLLRDQLASICAVQSQRWSMEVAMDVMSPLPDLGPSQSWDLQCIVEEALTNAAKHGEATDAGVTISAGPEAGTVTLSVIDNGKGMPASDLGQAAEDKIGLRGIQTRAARLNGDMSIQSKPGSTVVTVEIPLSQLAEGRSGS